MLQVNFLLCVRLCRHVFPRGDSLGAPQSQQTSLPVILLTSPRMALVSSWTMLFSPTCWSPLKALFSASSLLFCSTEIQLQGGGGVWGQHWVRGGGRCAEGGRRQRIQMQEALWHIFLCVHTHHKHTHHKHTPTHHKHKSSKEGTEHLHLTIWVVLSLKVICSVVYKRNGAKERGRGCERGGWGGEQEKGSDWGGSETERSMKSSKE